MFNIYFVYKFYKDQLDSASVLHLKLVPKLKELKFVECQTVKVQVSLETKIIDLTRKNKQTKLGFKIQKMFLYFKTPMIVKTYCSL